MTPILERRQSLQKSLADKDKQIVQLRKQTGQMQALANIGMVSAMIAHEMNNILTPLGNYAQLSIDNPEDTELAKKAIQKTAANSGRAAKILESMLAMANGQKQEKKYHQINTLIDDIFNCLVRDFGKDRIKVSIDIPEGLLVYGESICIQQVIMNFILNARQAMIEKGGNLTISAYDENDSVVIEVADTGCGIKPENLEKIFEPFYTTRKQKEGADRSGAGLGLAFCKQVVESHKGMIKVDSTPGDGTKFKVALPKY